MDVFGLDVGTLSTILTTVLTVATAILGTKYNKYKKLIIQIINALEDDSLSKQELKNIVKAIRNL